MAYKIKIKSATGNYDGTISYDDFSIEGVGESGVNYTLAKKFLSLLDLFRKVYDDFGDIEEIEITKLPV